MRILVITPVLWPEWSLQSQTIKALHDKGHTITLVCGKKRSSAECMQNEAFFKALGIHIEAMPIRYNRRGHWGSLLQSAVFTLKVQRLILSRLSSRYFDIILSYQHGAFFSGLPAVLLSNALDAAVATWLADFDPGTFHKASSIAAGWQRKLFGYIMRKSDLVLSSSLDFMVQLQTSTQMSQNVGYFPGWAAGHITKQNQPLKQGRADNRFCISLLLGRLSNSEIEILVDVAEVFKDSGLVWHLHGYESSVKSFATLADNRNISLFFKDAHSDPADSDLTLVADTFATEDPDRRVNFVAEGLALRNPLIVLQDSKEAALVHRSGSGLHVASWQLSEIVQSIDWIMRATPDKRVSLGRNAGRLYDNTFSKEKNIYNLEQWFEDINSGRAPYIVQKVLP